jgi:hypothetical protein
MKRLSILCTTILVALLFLTLATGCPQQPSSDSSELQEFMAQAIVDNCISPEYEGVYVVQLVSSSTPDEPPSILRIWEYEQGQLVDGDEDALMLALNSDQSIDWRPIVLVFEFTSVTPDSAEVNVETWWSMGGHSEIWHLAKQDGQWTVVSAEVDMFWD